MQSKDLSLIGFAVKARKVVFGLNQIKSCKKRFALCLYATLPRKAPNTPP